MLGDLVTYLKVDNRQFSSGLKKSSSSIKTFATGAKASLAGVTAAFAPLIAAAGAYLGVSKSLGAFKTQLESEKKLAAALEATGGAAGLSAQEIAAYASELQGMTNFGDEATLSVAAMVASFKTIKDDEFKRTLAVSQDLAAMLGKDLNESAKQVAKALADPVAGMGALAESGVVFTEAEREVIKAMQEAGDTAAAQQAILSKLEGQYGGSAAALADPWTQFTNVVADFAEMLGSVVSPSIAVVSTFLAELGNSVTSNAGYWRELGISIATWTIEAVAMLSQIGSIVQIQAMQWILSITQIVEETKHAFTSMIPAYVQWFSDNWQDLFFTMGDYALTIFVNLGENLRTIWRAVLDFFSGNPINLDFKPLLEGAKSAISDLPDIPDRVATEFEKTLQEDINTLQAGTAAAMQETRDSLTASLNKFMDVTANVPETFSEMTDSASNLGESKAKGPQFAGAQLAGSADAFSTIVQAMGRRNDPQVKAIDKVEKAIVNKVGKPLERLVNKQPAVIESLG